MSNAITTANHFSPDQVALIKSHLMASGNDAKQPSDADLQFYGLVCQRLQLDPFSKQIYAIQRKGKWTFQISVDGLRAIADRTGQYAGSDEPLFDEGLTEFECEEKGRKMPTVCKVTVYKLVQGQKCAFVGVAKYSEFVTTFYDEKKREHTPSETWKKMPYSMLAKCAESQALRKAFPQVVQVEKSVNTQPIEAETIDAQTVEDEWRNAGANWAISQGLSPQDAYDISQAASSKQNLKDRVVSALQNQAKTEPTP